MTENVFKLNDPTAVPLFNKNMMVKQYFSLEMQNKELFKIFDEDSFNIIAVEYLFTLIMRL